MLFITLGSANCTDVRPSSFHGGKHTLLEVGVAVNPSITCAYAWAGVENTSVDVAVAELLS